MRKLFFLAAILHGVFTYAQPGIQYDNTFGTYSGMELTRISQGSGYQDMQVQQDGKPVCAGTYSTGLFNQPALVRYKLNGTPDSSFGVNGVAPSFLDNADVILFAMCLQPDGKIVVAGYTTFTSLSTTNFILARYKSNGYPDSSFGTNGYVIIDAGPFQDWLHDVKLQTDGKIVASGYTFNGQHYVFAAVRRNADGTPDNTFDGDGLVLIDANVSNSQCLGLALQNDGKLLLAGFSNDINDRSNFTIARLKVNGTPDSSFGTNGVVYPVTTALSERLEDIIVLPDGGIVAAGEAIFNSTYRSDFALVKLKSDGAMDMDFGNGGITLTNLWNTLSIPKKIALQDDLKLIVTGYINLPNSNIPGDVVLLRYNTNGTLDTGFDADGDIGNDGADPDNSVLGTAVALYGQRIYVAGTVVPYPSSFPRSGFIIAAINTGSPVAVSLQQFNAVRKTGSIHLHWQTGTGIPLEFVIERSKDGLHFTAVGKVSATVDKNYRYIDAAAFQTRCFYRIKIIEADGSYSYSTIAKVPGVNAGIQLSLYPNPVKDILTVSLTGALEGISIKITDNGGRIVKEITGVTTAPSSCTMDVSNLPAGNYYITVLSPEGVKYKKFIKF